MTTVMDDNVSEGDVSVIASRDKCFFDNSFVTSELGRYWFPSPDKTLT